MPAMPAMPAMSRIDFDADADYLEADEGPLFSACRTAEASPASASFIARMLPRDRPRAQRDERRARMHALIARQRADGSWELDEDLADIVGVPLGALVSEIGASSVEHEVRRAWATALAIAWLQLRVADMEVEWQLLADKARGWLDQVPARPTGSRTWMEAARDRLI